MNSNLPKNCRKGTAMAASNQPTRRLIEEWLPINEISVDAIREGGALAGHPPVNQLHVWSPRELPLPRRFSSSTRTPRALLQLWVAVRL